MARVAQLIEETVDCDFVDINMGCPIGKAALCESYIQRFILVM
jgi:tRNA-dihydrouridine synthase